jgi:DNA-binding IclR family transcriptional regulator
MRTAVEKGKGKGPSGNRSLDAFDDDDRRGRFSTSLRTGLQILASFDKENPTRGIANLSDHLGLGRSTIHRYTTTLAALGYLEQGTSRKYRLSSRVADFGISALESLALRRAGSEHVRGLRDGCGHTCGLSVLEGGETLYVEYLRGHRRGQYAIDEGLGLGLRLPVHCTAAGKVLLAHLPEAERQGALGEIALTRRGPNTIKGKRAFVAELESVREQGLAIEDEELVKGRLAIAVPVFGDDERVVGAIEVAVPAETHPREELADRFVVAMTAATTRISADYEP